MGLKEIVSRIWHNHSLMMILCCAVPLVLILALSVLGFSSYSFWLVLLLCPLMHLLMMKDMGKHEHKEKEDPIDEGDAKCH